jgi:hypothetical protein
MKRFLLLFALLASSRLILACDDGAKRVPPAAQWKPPDVEPSVVGTDVTGGGARDAHRGAGQRPSRSPHDGDGPHRMEGEDAEDPHAGLGIDTGDPHAGMDMGAEDDLGGLEPPDPDRPIDPKKFLRGRIRAGAKAGTIAPGAIVFVSAWPIDKATGEVLGSPLAVEKLTADKMPLEFRLDERNMMVKGTRFEGDVLIVARIDKDGEARTKEPGDIEGRLRARVPADKLDLVLDTVLR